MVWNLNPSGRVRDSSVLQIIQLSSGTYPASYSVGTGVRIRMSGAIPLLLYACMAWTSPYPDRLFTDESRD